MEQVVGNHVTSNFYCCEGGKGNFINIHIHLYINFPATSSFPDEDAEVDLMGSSESFVQINSNK